MGRASAISVYYLIIALLSVFMDSGAFFVLG
jgi:hypothetical protein